MMNRRLLYVSFLSLLPHSAVGDTGCYGDLGSEVYGECETAFDNCFDCIDIGVKSKTNRCGWCASTQTCETRLSFYSSTCSDGTAMSKETCPYNADDPPFAGETCVQLEWTYYYCTSTPGDYGACDQSFKRNRCSANKHQVVALCNGQSYKFTDGVMTGATVSKSDAGAEFHLVGGFKSCYETEIDLVQDKLICHSTKKHAIQYTLSSVNMGNQGTLNGNAEGGDNSNIDYSAAVGRNFVLWMIMLGVGVLLV